MQGIQATHSQKILQEAQGQLDFLGLQATAEIVSASAPQLSHAGCMRQEQTTRSAVRSEFRLSGIDGCINLASTMKTCRRDSA